MVGADNAPFDRKCIVKWLERHDQLHGGAIGIGNDQVMRCNVGSIHFGNDEWSVGVHAPCAAVVNDRATLRCETRGPFQTHGSSGTEQSNMRGRFQRLFNGSNAVQLSSENNFFSNAAIAADWQQIAHGEIQFFQHLEHRAPYHSRGTDDGHVDCGMSI